MVPSVPHLLFWLVGIVASKTTTAMTMPYCLNVKMKVQTEARDDFMKIIRMDRDETIAKEPGNLQFVVGQDTSTDNIFYLHEEYTDEDAFVAHTKTPHFAKWKEFCDTNPWCEGGTPVVEFYQGTHKAQKMPSVLPAYCLNVNLYPKPDVREKFLEVIAGNKKGSDENEPLCLQYVYGESTETPNLFHFHEEYTGKEDGKEGFEAHAKAPHFAVWEAFASTGEPFTKPPEVSFFKAI